METSLSSGQLSGIQKDELMEQVKQQIAVANAQELLTVYPIEFRICGMQRVSVLLYDLLNA
jgi:hypothetical protein